MDSLQGSCKSSIVVSMNMLECSLMYVQEAMPVCCLQKYKGGAAPKNAK